MILLRPLIRGSLVISLTVFVATMVPATVAGGLLDGCWSTATPVGFPANIAVCPAGDGQTLADVGARIDAVTRDPQGNPVQFIPWQDIWIMDCSLNPLCWSVLSSNADAATDVDGRTTISGTIAAGGMHAGVNVFMQAIVVLSKPECDVPQCIELGFRSVDIDGDLAVNMIDLAQFASAFSPNPYNAAADYNFDGMIGLVDLAFFAAHFGHACP